MVNQKVLKVLNILMALAFLTVATCAIIMWIDDNAVTTVLPIHMPAGKVFIFLAVIHIILNWNWVKSQIFGIKPKPKAKKA